MYSCASMLACLSVINDLELLADLSNKRGSLRASITDKHGTMTASQFILGTHDEGTSASAAG
ncbi:hypothetical protein BC830DRAFT_1147417 [Chytriomyces sp. MP71]|nr:hypothetical protein BC830DRAFT_1147417 [Chytriomyces sp. MP71]